MRLRVIREPSIAGATLGVLFVDDVFFSFTLEDQIREVPGRPVSEWKIPGKTAIPSGRYPVKLTRSPRFQKMLPEVLSVPGFVGVRIHSGNKASDTEGCVLLGFERVNAEVRDSRAAVGELMNRMELAQQDGEAIELVVENPLSYGG